MTNRVDVAVLISGRGSNMEALMDACERPDFPARIVRVISNVPGAKGLETAASRGIRTTVIDHRAFENRADFEQALHQELNACDVGLVCLAGFMRLLGSDFVDRWTDRMMNIHPSLLPSFRGLDTHARALEEGVRFHGCTVHLVRPDMDTGPILLQAVVPVQEDDTPQTLGARVLEQEHIIYPEALRLMALGHVTVNGGRTRIRNTSSPLQTLVSPLSAKVT